MVVAGSWVSGLLGQSGAQQRKSTLSGAHNAVGSAPMWKAVTYFVGLLHQGARMLNVPLKPCHGQHDPSVSPNPSPHQVQALPLGRWQSYSIP